MGDVFKEQLVKKLPSMRTRILRFLVIAAAVVITISALMAIPQFGVIVAFAVCFGAYYLMSFFNIEYEYVFTNGDLDIDIIYSKARRKRLLTTHLNKADIMCHVEDTMKIGELSGAEVTLDYSSGVVNEYTYAFLTMHNNKRTKIIIEPNEKMLKAISGVLTRRKLFLKP